MANVLIEGFQQANRENQIDRGLDQQDTRMKQLQQQVQIMQDQNDRTQKVSDDLDVNEALFDLDTTKDWQGIKGVLPRIKGLTNGKFSVNLLDPSDVYVDGKAPQPLAPGQDPYFNRVDGKVFHNGNEVKPEFVGKVQDTMGLQDAELDDNNFLKNPQPFADSLRDARVVSDTVINPDGTERQMNTYATPESFITGIGPMSGYQAFKFDKLAKLAKAKGNTVGFDELTLLADMKGALNRGETLSDSINPQDPDGGKFGASALEKYRILTEKFGVAKKYATDSLTASTSGGDKPNARELLVNASEGKTVDPNYLWNNRNKIAGYKRDEQTVGNQFKDDSDIRPRTASIASLKDMQTKVNDAKWLQDNMQTGDLERVKTALPENFDSMNTTDQIEILNQISLNSELSTGMQSLLKVISGVSVSDEERANFMKTMFGGDITKVNPKVISAALGGMIKSNATTAQAEIDQISPTQFPGTKAELALSLYRAQHPEFNPEADESPTGAIITSNVPEGEQGGDITKTGDDAQSAATSQATKRAITNFTNKAGGIYDATVGRAVKGLSDGLVSMGEDLNEKARINSAFTRLSKDDENVGLFDSFTPTEKLAYSIQSIADRPEFDPLKGAGLTDEEIVGYLGTKEFQDDKEFANGGQIDTEKAVEWKNSYDPVATRDLVTTGLEMAAGGGVAGAGYKTAKGLKKANDLRKGNKFDLADNLKSTRGAEDRMKQFAEIDAKELEEATKNLKLAENLKNSRPSKANSDAFEEAGRVVESAKNSGRARQRANKELLEVLRDEKITDEVRKEKVKAIFDKLTGLGLTLGGGALTYGALFGDD